MRHWNRLSFEYNVVTRDYGQATAGARAAPNARYSLDLDLAKRRATKTGSARRLPGGSQFAVNRIQHAVDELRRFFV